MSHKQSRKRRCKLKAVLMQFHLEGKQKDNEKALLWPRPWGPPALGPPRRQTLTLNVHLEPLPGPLGAEAPQLPRCRERQVDRSDPLVISVLCVAGGSSPVRMGVPEEERVASCVLYKPPAAADFVDLQTMATTQCSLLLASSSGCRRALFAAAAIPFGAFSPGFEEDEVQDWLEARGPSLDCEQRTLLIAQLKASAAIHALRGPLQDKLQQLRFQNQVLNLAAAARPGLLEAADREARQTGKAAAAVAQLASFEESAAAIEASDGRRPVLIAVDTGVEHEGRVLFKPKDEADAARMLQLYSASDTPVRVTSSVVLVDLCRELDDPPPDPNACMPLVGERSGPHRCKACSKLQQPADSKQPADEQEEACCCPPSVVHAASMVDGFRSARSFNSFSRKAFSVTSTIAFAEMDEEARKRILQEEGILNAAGAIRIEAPSMATHITAISGCMHSIIGFPLSRLKDELNELQLSVQHSHIV
ncbi:hypothetical protein Efla_002541 [Eimeria flavescens]